MQHFRQTTDRTQPEQDRPLPGVIDTIGLGYASLALRPLIVLPPILLDLYLWLGMRVTARPLTLEVASWIRREGEDGDAIAKDIQRFERTNVLELLSLRLPTFRMPTLVPNLTSARLEQIGGTFDVGSLPWWLVIAIAVIALLVGLVLGAGWLIAVACVVAGIGSLRDAVSPAITLRRAVAMLGWLAVLIALFLLVSSPFIVGALAGIMSGYDGIGLFVLVLLFPAAWGYLFFYFSIQAIVVDRTGPLGALRASYKVVRSYFWQSMGFIGLSLTITTGIPFALRVFTTNAVGLVLAIIGNAFIASGMIAAAMLFYRDRARRLGLPAFVTER